MSIQYIRKVLHHDLGARYARIRKIPALANKPRCLMLRQHYARFMLGQLAEGVKVINLD